MKRGRPYPPDRERRVRVKIELARRDMSISDLARALNVNRGHLSETIGGARRTKSIEERIAAYFGVPEGELFPRRTKGEIEAMRRALAGKGGAAWA
jgi:transcriptional regulator with XRE-family HTH domain